VGLTDLGESKLQQFHKQLKALVGSPESFRRNIEVGKMHIYKRASETSNMFRYVFDSESIAALIFGGIINVPKSAKSHPLQLAIEGVFKELRVVDWDKKEERIIKKLAVRVIVKESRPKHFVVTIYPDDGSGDFDIKKLPEVSNDFWNT
jgi:hypothetical protein